MDDVIKVTCPDCANVLVVRKRDGKLLEVRRPILEESTGDRFEDAMKKVRGEKDAIAKKFEEARERERTKHERLDALFKEGLERAKAEGPITKPIKPMDLD